MYRKTVSVDLKLRTENSTNIEFDNYCEFSKPFIAARSYTMLTHLKTYCLLL